MRRAITIQCPYCGVEQNFIVTDDKVVAGRQIAYCNNEEYFDACGEPFVIDLKVTINADVYPIGRKHGFYSG